MTSNSTQPESPTLVIIRGNSGSGKTTAAREARRRFGRGAALLEQDHLRRIVLREHDSAHIDPVAPVFITAVARTALDLGYHVILEGILHTERYATVLHQLIDNHPGLVAVFYLDVSFDETVRRHLNRAEPIPVAQTVTTILHASGLATAIPQTPCPRRCRHCAHQSVQQTRQPR